MALFADRVKDTTTTTGTGALTLADSAPTGFQTFNAAFGTGVNFYYAISSSGGAEWEVGIGVLTTSTSMTRSTITASSNAGAAVNFSAGTKDVYCTIAAKQEVNPVFDTLDVTGTSTLAGVELVSLANASGGNLIYQEQITTIGRALVAPSAFL